MRIAFAALLGLCFLAPAARAAGLADRVRSEGIVHCGATERPGIAEQLPDGSIGGIAVDVCKAVAVAVLGPQGRVSFGLYDADKTFDPVRDGTDEIAFLTGGEIADQDLGGVLIPGPAVAINQIAVMVHDTAPIHDLADLSGQSVCLMTGSSAQAAFEAVAERRHITPIRTPFSEDVEMLDAYNAGHCAAAVGEVTYLADMRRNTGINREPSRLLPEPLAAEPIVAATNVADGAWASAVAWVFDALLLADAPHEGWTAEGADALPVKQVPGLRVDWRADVVHALGSYAAIVHTDFTVNLGLPAGPNALWPAGALLAPYVR